MTTTIDRESRDALIEAINAYLDEEIMGFKFDETIDAIRDGTDDKTVHHVVFSLWMFSDDFNDHHVNLNREGWDYLQRLLLLLNSDACIVKESSRTWCETQCLAAKCILLFTYFAAKLGIGLHLLAIAVPFGITSMWINRRRSRRIEASVVKPWRLDPFESFATLSAVRETVPTFKKRRYSGIDQASHSHVETFGNLLQQFAVWFIFFPLVLLVQMLPQRHSRTRVVLPPAENTAHAA
jgi:hypothetical protein